MSIIERRRWQLHLLLLPYCVLAVAVEHLGCSRTSLDDAKLQGLSVNKSPRSTLQTRLHCMLLCIYLSGTRLMRNQWA